MNTKTKHQLEIDFGKTLIVDGPRIGVAVSGGSDSVALLYLVCTWAKNNNKTVVAVTVDHNLRKEVKSEIKFISRICSDLSISHDVLSWKNWGGNGNLQAKARQARYKLINEWASKNNIDLVVLGHTKNDVVENFIIRMSRDSGVDGLSQILPFFSSENVNYGRPLIDIERDDLRRYLNFKKVEWIEDPSNENSKFQRVRVRKKLVHLKKMGMDLENIATVSKNLRVSRDALEFYTDRLAKTCTIFKEGDIIFKLDLFFQEPLDIQRRLLIKAIKFLGEYEFGPRRSEINNLLCSFQKRESHTLRGFHFYYYENGMRMSREYNAINELCGKPNEIWDNRWFIKGPKSSNYIIKPLGEKGLSALSEWKDKDIPRLALLSSPAVWHKNELKIVLFRDRVNSWSLKPLKQEKEFLIYDKVLNH